MKRMSFYAATFFAAWLFSGAAFAVPNANADAQALALTKQVQAFVATKAGNSVRTEGEWQRRNQLLTAAGALEITADTAQSHAETRVSPYLQAQLQLALDSLQAISR